MGAGELRHKASAMRNQADFSRWCSWAPILSASVSLSLSLSVCVCLPLPAEDWAQLWFKGKGSGLLIKIFGGLMF